MKRIFILIFLGLFFAVPIGALAVDESTPPAVSPSRSPRVSPPTTKGLERATEVQKQNDARKALKDEINAKRRALLERQKKEMEALREKQKKEREEFERTVKEQLKTSLLEQTWDKLFSLADTVLQVSASITNKLLPFSK
ncbi:MAG TPA: hypothetical protein VEK36_00610 [Candidatus Paceibacterota bacterium]|nr:hypothetical protein [Candidatus Paceibacterota bacterium]